MYKESIHCPHCHEYLGKSENGKAKVRLSIVLLDRDTGTVSGPCKQCKNDVVISSHGEINKALCRSGKVVPALRLTRGERPR